MKISGNVMFFISELFFYTLLAKNVQICRKYVKYWKYVIFLKNGKYVILTYLFIFVESTTTINLIFCLISLLQIFDRNRGSVTTYWNEENVASKQTSGQ